MARREMDLDDAERIERTYQRPEAPTRLTDLGAGLANLFMTSLSEKSLLWFALVSSVGLWTFAAIAPDYLRLGAAGGVTVLVYIPMLWKKR